MELPEPLDVIAVGAHPDDVEIACGGTLAKLVKQGYRVGIIDLTDGEPTPHSDGPHIRLAEAEQARQALGLQVRLTLDLPNRRLFDSFESRVLLARELRRYRPKVVIGFGGKTPTASPDHWQAMLITDAAVFYSRLSKWDDHFPGLPTHTVPVQLYYSLVFYSLEVPREAGHFVVDIGETMEQKIASVACYKSQFPPSKGDMPQRLRGLAIHYGTSAGFEAGELLFSTRTLGTGDLMSFCRLG
jgi:bacillithiol biosynthesis deacetylase BshB1